LSGSETHHLSPKRERLSASIDVTDEKTQAAISQIGLKKKPAEVKKTPTKSARLSVHFQHK
jgi:hypothetical protein